MKANADKYHINHINLDVILESAKLRALRALRAYVLTCQRANVLTCLACLHTQVPKCVACLRAHVPTCPACFACHHALRTLRADALTCYNYRQEK